MRNRLREVSSRYQEDFDGDVQFNLFGTGLNLSSSLLREVKKWHQKDEQEIIVMFHSKKATQGNQEYHFSTCISETGISFCEAIVTATQTEAPSEQNLWGIFNKNSSKIEITTHYNECKYFSWDEISEFIDTDELYEEDEDEYDEIQENATIIFPKAIELYGREAFVLFLLSDGRYINIPVAFFAHIEKESIELVNDLIYNYRAYKEELSKRGLNNMLSLSNEEKLYFDEVTAIKNTQGTITDKDREILERFRVRLGISEERATQLEEDAFTQSSLTEQEEEYLSELKNLANEDGEIPNNVRKILANFAKTLNISEERAKEIEENYL